MEKLLELLLIKILASQESLVRAAILIFLGLAIRLTLQMFGQTWIQTKAHTTTLLILPIITYVITNLISGNIALSLGMVGALSIVRFRNPVRSPLELSVYFLAITMGIAASVSLHWLLFLVLAISMAIITLILVNKVSSVFFSVTFFTTSFSEGNSLSSINIICNDHNKILDNHELLHSKTVSIPNASVQYYLVSNNFNLLRDLHESLKDSQTLISIELRR